MAVFVCRSSTRSPNAALVTDRKWCSDCAARIASMAMRTLPSVPFLKPTGHGKPTRQFAVQLRDSVVRTDRALKR